jgi:hypothetical protein
MIKKEPAKGRLVVSDDEPLVGVGQLAVSYFVFSVVCCFKL